MSITTRNGDQGSTRLFSGEKVSKSHLAPRAYGALDEANSILGIVRSQTESKELADLILYLQNTCYEVGGDLATHPDSGKQPRLTTELMDKLDEIRDEIEAVTEMPKDFVMSGGTVLGAHLDHARTVFRRCEQEAVALSEAGGLNNPLVLTWLNRVSDLMWLLARNVEGEKTLPRRVVKQTRFGE